MLHDYTGKSIFLPSNVRADLNKQIHDYFAWLADLFTGRQVPANLYLTGSLSRQEPSVTWNERGELRLFSDIDFIIGTTEEMLQDPWLLQVEGELQRRFPQFHTTILLLHAYELDKTRSCFSRDLALSLGQPVYQALDVPGFVPERIGRDQLFETIIHQLSNFYLHPTQSGVEASRTIYFRSDMQYHYLKFVLECLRAQFPDPEEQVIGFSDVYAKRFDPRLRHIMTPDQIAEYIRARELFGQCPSPELPMIEVLTSSLLLYLDVTERDVSWDALLRHLAQKAAESAHILPSYQYALIAYVLASHEQGERKRQALRVFSGIVRSMDKTHLVRSTAFIERAGAETWERLPESADDRQLFIQQMNEFRTDYIRQWRMKNTGETELVI